MRATRILICAALALTTSGTPAFAQQVFKCDDGKGGHAYQQTQCSSDASTKAVVPIRRDPPRPSAPQGTGHPFSGETSVAPQHAERRAQRDTGMTISAQAPAQPAADLPTGYVRCVGADGRSYLRRSNSCPERAERVEQRAGMVLDVTTGQQHFMVPGGGNGMIDPRTGQRHELISPPPTRTLRDQAVSVDRNQACTEERARRETSLSDRNRTIDSIRAANARYDRMCK